MIRVIVRPAAAADIDEAFLWYERRRPGLGDEFLAAVESVRESIAAHPAMCPVIRRDTRRALVRRFPYAIFYRVYEDVIVIVACMHAKRDPRRWMSRT
ncbi:MAG: type II toxin-antitoxin system RelE/ParE family toxin [Acidobacteria bacterium]|nr:type II toxin-antitoxin system RelE/ParE family toxin [Acidobacteriota bacterium]